MSKIQDFIKEDIKKHPELKKEYEQTSRNLDEAMANFKKGKVSAPVDLSDLKKQIKKRSLTSCVGKAFLSITIQIFLLRCTISIT